MMYSELLERRMLLSSAASSDNAEMLELASKQLETKN